MIELCAVLTIATMRMLSVILFVTIASTFGEEFEQSLVSGNNLFTASIYKEVSKKGENNFLVSPFSARIILSLAQSGAEGETQAELRAGLQLPNDQNKIETGFKALLPKLKSGNLYTFRTANKVYIKENFTIKNEFKKVARDVFDAGLENIQFFPNNIEAAKTMNKWVEDQTENKIQGLISDDSLDEETVAVLINALYFKGNWTFPFPKFFTGKQKFYQSDKKETEVETMHVYEPEEQCNYHESEELDAKFLELLFKGGDVSMVFVLPNEKEGLTNLEKQASKVFRVRNFNQEFVKISLPKFKIESEIGFKEILQNLFESGAAFSGISDSSLLVNDVFQKTYIDVNEDGVEAAAATYLDFRGDIGFELLVPPKEFYADHPFMFYIKMKDLIVFAGRVGAPTYL